MHENPQNMLQVLIMYQNNKLKMRRSNDNRGIKFSFMCVSISHFAILENIALKLVENFTCCLAMVTIFFQFHALRVSFTALKGVN